MSREWTHYSLKCTQCGAHGKVDMWDDDWCRWGMEMTGFVGKVRVTGPKPHDLNCETCRSGDPKVELLSDERGR